MGDITANFSMEEFLVSNTAEREGIENVPTPEHEERIRTRLAPALQTIRDELKRSITILSAYRCPELSALVGGTSTSAHPQGFAADVVAAGLSAKGLAEWIAARPHLMALIDQLILETSRGVVHIGVGPKLRHEVLTQAKGAGTPLQSGIH